MIPLPTFIPPLAVPDCAGCGGCCDSIGTPPGFSAFFPVSGAVPGYAAAGPDAAHFAGVPAAAKADLAAYYAAVDRDDTPDRSAADCPCLWLDPVTKGCRYYPHRPEVCRQFRAGSVSCHAHRARLGLGPEPPAGLEELE